MKTKDTKKKAVKPTVKTDKKKGAPAKAPAKAAAKAATPKRTPMDIPAAKLQHAPWNPRAKITPESVADLTASIIKDGLIQRLVVVADGSKYTVVAGNRRLVACREARLDPIPCEVMDVTQDQARRMTLLENLQRKDVDPILESELIEKLLADVMTQAEIAAETGRGERWVARRKNLKNLSPAWRKRAQAGRVGTDCLEHIAAYPLEIQEKLKDRVLWKDTTDAGLRWNDIADHFIKESCDLKVAGFNTRPCRTCPHNSGASPELFDWSNDKPTPLGKCLCAKCYHKKLDDAIAETIKKAKDDGLRVIEHAPNWSVDRSTRQTAKCNVLHVYRDYNGNKVVEWASPMPESATGGSDAEKEREAELAKKRETKERNKAIRALAEWCAKDDNLENCIRQRFTDEATGEIRPWVPLAFQTAFSGIGTCRLVGTQTDKEKCAAAMAFGTFHVPGCFAKWIAREIIRYLDPGRSQAYYAVPNAKLILALFPEAKEGIGPQAKVAIALDEALESLKTPEVKWIDPDADESKADTFDGDADDDADWDQEAEM